MTNLQKLCQIQGIENDFITRVQKTNNCWNWNGTITSWGYGHFKKDGKLYRAHRVSYQLFKGHIPKGLLVCHSCDNRKCVNPEHLWLGTNEQNSKDMSLKGRGVGNKIKHKRGELHPMAKLSKIEVEEIRSLLNKGMPQRKIANIYGVVQGTIANIKSGGWL